jgi:hypothetical protein
LLTVREEVCLSTTRAKVTHTILLLFLDDNMNNDDDKNDPMAQLLLWQLTKVDLWYDEGELKKTK